MSKFALSEMQKYGWSKGKGLGANEEGRTQPVTVKIKQDSHGVGFNPSDVYTNFWWEDCFNKASANITVTNSQEDVQIISKQKKIDKNSLKTICKPNPSKYKLYPNFVQPSVINETVTDETQSKQVKLSKNQRRTEKKVKKCRYHRTQNGKLARLANQEKNLISCKPK